MIVRFADVSCMLTEANRYRRRTPLLMRHRPRINVHRGGVSSLVKPALRCTDVAVREYDELQDMVRRAPYSPKTVLHGRLSSEERKSSIDLLYEDAASAKEILPAMTKEAYLAYQRGLFRRQRSAYAEE